MAYVCYDCQIIFPSKRSNCPFCGQRIYFDEKSEYALQSEGFTLFDTKERHDNAEPVASDSFSIDDSDILSSLRRSYEREHRRTDHTDDRNSGEPQETTNQSASQGSAGTIPKNTSTQEEVRQDANDFFSQFQSSAAPSTSIPTVETPSETNSSFASPIDDDLERELQSIRRQQRRINSHYRRMSTINFIRNINWLVVFRLILVIAVVIGIITIWNMRYVILESIISFLTGLIPLVVVSLIIVAIFKSFFR